MLTVEAFLKQIESQESQKAQEQQINSIRTESNINPKLDQKNDDNHVLSSKDKEPAKNSKVNKKKKKNDKKKKQNNVQQNKPEISPDEPVNFPDFQYIRPNEELAIQDYLKPYPEWEKKLVHWFSFLRMYLGGLSNPKLNTNFESIQRFIESNELPKTTQIGDQDIIIQILSYFSQKETFTKNELFWLFSYLTIIDRLSQPEICQYLQKILDIVLKQIQALGTSDPYNELLPYLNIISSLIQRFFHQPSI